MTAFVVCVLLSQAPGVVEEPRAEEPRAEIDKAFAEETPRQVKVTLNDGRIVAGKLLLRDDMQMLVLTEDGQPVQIDVDQVKRYEEPLPNRNRARYLFGSSALLPEPGQVTLTQLEALATVIEVGISDHFSFQAGTSVPAYFLGKDGINAYAAVKAALSFMKYVHLALELKFLALGFWSRRSVSSTAIPAAGLAALTLTIGSEDLNFSVTAGPQLDFTKLTDSGGQVVGLPIVTLSAFARVHQNVGLITENWAIPDFNGPGKWFVADALAARFFGERWAVDLGVLVMPTQFYVDGPVPSVLPWLSFSYHFL